MKNYVIFAILIIATSFAVKAQPNTYELLCENECTDIFSDVYQ